MRKSNTEHKAPCLLSEFRENREKFAIRERSVLEQDLDSNDAQKQKLAFIVVHRYSFAWFRVTLLGNLFSSNQKVE